MGSITFWVEGRPAAAARPRVTRNGTFTPLATRLWKTAVTTACWSATPAPGRPKKFTGPVRAMLRFYFAPARSQTKAERKLLLGRPRTSKPDADNLAKAVLDALNGLVYDDDAQVVDLSVTKCYEETEGVRVYIEEIEE